MDEESWGAGGGRKEPGSQLKESHKVAGRGFLRVRAQKKKRDDEKNFGCAGFLFDGLEGVDQDGVADGWRGFQSVRLTDGLIKAKCVSVCFHYVHAVICIANKIPPSR